MATAAAQEEIADPATDELLYEVRDGIGFVTFNRPQARNAMTFAMYERLAEICTEVDAGHSVKALILTGRGRQSLCGRHRHFAVPRLQDARGRDRLREPHRPRARRARALPGADHRGDPGLLHRRRARHRHPLRPAHRRAAANSASRSPARSATACRWATTPAWRR
jgi:hypothetical protein